MDLLSLPPGVSDAPLYRRRMRMFREEVTVYPVSCELLANGRSDRQWLASVLAGGARIVQLRDKESPDHLLLEKAHFFRTLTRRYDALFVVNDRVDIAVRADADGVHVGQGDLDPAEVRRLAPDMIVGLSCNTFEQVYRLGEEVRAATSAVSYYNIGPLFLTETKAGLPSFLGTKAVVDYGTHCSLPFTVMGGIKYHHIDELCRIGAQRIAVVTALTQAADIAVETRRWISRIRMATEKNG